MQFLIYEKKKKKENCLFLLPTRALSTHEHFIGIFLKKIYSSTHLDFDQKFHTHNLCKKHIKFS